MTEPPSLSLTEWVVLGVIGEQPAHGFAVSALTSGEGDLGRIWHIPRPAIYRALGRVEAAGLIAAEGVAPGHGERGARLPERHHACRPVAAPVRRAVHVAGSQEPGPEPCCLVSPRSVSRAPFVPGGYHRSAADTAPVSPTGMVPASN